MQNNNLPNTSTENIDDIISEDIKLNDQQVEALKNSVEELKLKADETFIERELNRLEEGTSTSFEESFPDFIPKEALFNKLSKYFSMDSKVIEEILKREGITTFATKFSSTSDKDFNLELKELKEKLESTIQEVEKIQEVLKSSKLLDISKTFDQYENLTKLLDRILEIFIQNQSSINVIVHTAKFVSPFLVYRTLLKAYINTTLGHVPENAKEIFLEKRRLHVKNFNRYSIPLNGCFWIITQSSLLNPNLINKDIFTYDMSKTETTSTIGSSSIFLSNKNNNNNWYVFIMFILLPLCIWIFPVALKYFNLSLYDYLNTLITNYGIYYIKLVVIIWMVGWILSYILELYLFIMLSLNAIHKPEILPKFILNWINRIEADTKLNLPHTFISMYLKIILFYIVISLLYTFIFLI